MYVGVTDWWTVLPIATFLDVCYYLQKPTPLY